MPLDRTKVDRMIAKMDAWLKQRDQEIAAGTYYDDDDQEDEPPCDPLDAPQQPFSDSPPEKIHGQPEQDQELWPPKPRVPVPIEHL
jgi:hypothetical protein